MCYVVNICGTTTVHKKEELGLVSTAYKIVKKGHSRTAT